MHLLSLLPLFSIRKPEMIARFNVEMGWKFCIASPEGEVPGDSDVFTAFGCVIRQAEAVAFVMVSRNSHGIMDPCPGIIYHV